MIGVTWRSAQWMLHKLRTTMGERDAKYPLTGLVEVDDAFIGGKCSRGATGKIPVLLAVSRYGEGVGLLFAVAVESVNHLQVRQIIQCLEPTTTGGQFLPMVHIVAVNFKKFTLGTFHRVSGH